MTPRQIMLSDRDRDRLRDLLFADRVPDEETANYANTLKQELDRAKVVAANEIPRYTVTMNSCVRLTDRSSNTQIKCTLVYPEEADPEQGLQSVLSDLGLAILGFSVGDTVKWAMPDGVRQLRIDMLYFQPEASKQYEK